MNHSCFTCSSCTWFLRPKFVIRALFFYFTNFIPVGNETVVCLYQIVLLAKIIRKEC